MTNPRHRFRPRFSTRTMVIVVTLVCCYAACWGPTKKWGVKDVTQHARYASASATAPLIVSFEETGVALGFTGRESTRRRYYFWFFGYVAKLPWEREIAQQQSAEALLDGAFYPPRRVSGGLHDMPELITPPGSSPESQ